MHPASSLVPELKTRHMSVSTRAQLAHSLSVQPTAERPTTPTSALVGSIGGSQGLQPLLQASPSTSSYVGEPLLPLLPQYYYVPSECLDEERARPGSQARVASCSRPGEEPCYLLGQAVYLISQLLRMCRLFSSSSFPLPRTSIDLLIPRRSVDLWFPNSQRTTPPPSKTACSVRVVLECFFRVILQYVH